MSFEGHLHREKVNLLGPWTFILRSSDSCTANSPDASQFLTRFRLTYLSAQPKPDFRPRSSYLNPHLFPRTLPAMARATRSSAANEKQSEPAPTRGKVAAVASKKRKRGSVAEIEDQPSAKQLRSGDSSIKDEEVSDTQPTTEQPPTLQNAGDVPINSDDAQKILDILEMYVIYIVDSQNTQVQLYTGLIRKVCSIVYFPSIQIQQKHQAHNQPRTHSGIFLGIHLSILCSHCG